MSTGPDSTIDRLDPLTDLDETQETGQLAPLTVADRCDAADCGAQAYLRVRLNSGLDLVFCGHHGHALMPVLAARGAVVRDDSHLL